MTLPLKATITVAGVAGLPKDYYAEVMPDGSLVLGLGALGDLTTKTPDMKRPYHLGPHHVNVVDAAGTVLFDQDLSSHWWNACHAVRVKPLAASVTHAQMVAARDMFPMGDTGKPVGKVNNYVFKGPMDSAGVTIYMPTTGERPDIGLITDPSALYMLTGNSGPMLAWAQAAGSCPWRFRDEATGKPIDLLKYPTANEYWDAVQGYPRLPRGPLNAGGYPVYGGGWQPQEAHECEMSYYAFLATRDPVFLQGVQYAANFMPINDAALSAKLKKAVPHGEYRGISWSFRNLFMAHRATQIAEQAGTLPASCHPSSYWKTLLDQALAYYGQVITDPTPTRQYFRTVVDTGADRFAPWQADYMLEALAFGVLTGHPDWAPLYLWALKNAIDRTSGQSGYPPGWGGGYYYNAFEWAKNPDGTYNQNAYDRTKPLDWYGTFLFSQNDPNANMPTAAQIAALEADQFNGGKAFVGVPYLMATRGVLVQAQYLDDLGLCNVRQTYPDLDFCVSVVDRMLHNDPTPLVPRQSYIRPIPSTSTPVGALIMSLHTASIQVGQHIQIDLQVSPPGSKLATGPFYSSSDANVATEVSDATGALVAGVGEGTAKIIVTGTNPDGSTVTGECDLTVTAPFVLALDLVPGALS